jgi:hypothetical protein
MNYRPELIALGLDQVMEKVWEIWIFANLADLLADLRKQEAFDQFRCVC